MTYKPLWLPTAILLTNLAALGVSIAKGARVIVPFCAVAAAGAAWLVASRRKPDHRTEPEPEPEIGGIPHTAPDNFHAGLEIRFEAPDPPREKAAADPQRDGAWLQLVEECVGLVDELDRQMPKLDALGQDVADHVLCRIQEILVRCGVETIQGEGEFDRSRHQPDPPAAKVNAGRPIAETLSPGFAVGSRILRRARVQLAAGD